MIPKECKRLAEVDFPIAVVSAHAAREKSIRHGHPSTLHLWWARRPLASSRAMLMALLLPDPCDPSCPGKFKEQAREIVAEVRQKPGSEKELQRALLWFIGSFANWDLASDKTYLRVARNLVKAAHPDEPPLVVDPFAGGGSIPLEALRVGCDAFASDLNPVACLILKVMLEDIPRHGSKLANELRQVGAEIKRLAEKELAKLYPKDTNGTTPIAYLWARTVRCEAPNCGAEIPLLRSFWLSRKPKKKWALRPYVVQAKGGEPKIEFEIFAPTSSKEVHAGTVSLAKAKCLSCGSIVIPERVRAQLFAQGGGADAVFDDEGRRTGGARIMAVVTLPTSERGRHYCLPSDVDYSGVYLAQQHLAALFDEWKRGGHQGLSPVPDEPTPQDGTGSVGGGFRTRKYGVSEFGELFTMRQKVALVELSRLCREWSGVGQDSVRSALAIVVNRCADRLSTVCRWDTSRDTIANTFARQALPFVWDFCEGNPLSSSTGGYEGALDWVAKVVEAWRGSSTGQAQLADAAEYPLPDQAASLWFTDPPYYDAVPYADLSDFFFVWLKRTLPEHPLLRDPFEPSNALSPKIREAVRDEQEHLDGRAKKTAEWYEERMHRAFAEGRRVLREEGVGSVVFAHKTTEGWEALLSGLIRGGWTITGSWPIATEMTTRLRARESAALATSIHLVCRPRSEDTRTGDWAAVLRELPRRVVVWMERLQSEGVRGADLVFACIGPALEVFSRYSKVETAEGRKVGLPEYLEKVWEVVGRAALSQVLGIAEGAVNGTAAAALEDDARLSALFLWTFETTKIIDNGEGKKTEEDEEAAFKKKGVHMSLPFDVVRRIAQPLGIRLPDWEDRIIQIEKGVVRLLPIAERAQQLFGKEGAQAVADELESAPSGATQMTLFPEAAAAPPLKTRGRRKSRIHVTDDDLTARHEATTLDRVHAAMLLQSSGRANALRALLKAEQQRGPEFLRLANALSALYPKGTEERRLVEAMLQAVPK